MQNLSLTNTGSTTVNFNSIFITGVDPNDFKQSNTCFNGLTAGTTCTLAASLTPSVVGQRSASLELNPDPTSPQIIIVGGFGISHGSGVTVSLRFGIWL